MNCEQTYQQPTKAQTLSIVRELKEQEQCHEWYPTTSHQMQVIADDIKYLLSNYDLSRSYSDTIKLLDIGAGDGRVLKALDEALTNKDKQRSCELYAIEKATLHTNSYRQKGITLLGTDFHQCNFISKHCDIAFVNSPYSEFTHWIATLIMHLNFKVMYAIMPQRWEESAEITNAIKRRGIVSWDVLCESDFMDAHRQARAKVHIVRFSFNDVEKDKLRYEKAKQSKVRREWLCKPTLGLNSSDPFNIFIEDEIGLNQTHNTTTNKFHEHIEKERVRKELETEGAMSFELKESQGVLWALIENYESDMERVLSEYKKISELDPNLLSELGAEYKALCDGLREKLLGFRALYWSLLFEHLTILSSRLTGKHKANLLNTLNANALDFNHKNAIYIISYAVEMANDLVESSIIDVFQELTSEEAILKHYESNQHHYKDSWRYNKDLNNAKYILDYRFVSSHWSNFPTCSYSSRQGLNDDARQYVADIVVVLNLLGYSEFIYSDSYDNLTAGKKLIIKADGPEGKQKDLIHVRFYKNGNRHVQFSQQAMLRLNCTASRLLGWVRTKEDYQEQTGETVNSNDWAVGDTLKILTTDVFALADNKTKEF